MASAEVNYVEISFEAIVEFDQFEKNFLGNRTQRVCRICGQTGEEGATFRKDAHVIPAAFGNRSLLTYEECDICNEHIGSPLENHLADYLVLARVFGFIPRRNGKDVKHKRRTSFVESRRETRDVLFQKSAGDPDVDLEIIVAGRARATVVANPFNRTSVCKAVARMALLATPPEHFAELEHIVSWVKGDVSFRPTYVQFTIPGGIDALSLAVFRHVQADGRPGYRVAFACGSSLLVVELPLADWSRAGQTPTPFLANYYGDLMDGVVGDERLDIPDALERDMRVSCELTFGELHREEPESTAAADLNL